MFKDKENLLKSLKSGALPLTLLCCCFLSTMLISYSVSTRRLCMVSQCIHYPKGLNFFIWPCDSKVKVLRQKMTKTEGKKRKEKICLPPKAIWWSPMIKICIFLGPKTAHKNLTCKLFQGAQPRWPKFEFRNTFLPSGKAALVLRDPPHYI